MVFGLALYYSPLTFRAAFPVLGFSNRRRSRYGGSQQTIPITSVAPRYGEEAGADARSASASLATPISGTLKCRSGLQNDDFSSGVLMTARFIVMALYANRFSVGPVSMANLSASMVAIFIC